MTYITICGVPIGSLKPFLFNDLKPNSTNFIPAAFTAFKYSLTRLFGKSQLL